MKPPVPAIAHHAETGHVLEGYSLSVVRDIAAAVDQMWAHWVPQEILWDPETFSHSFKVYGGSCEFTVTITADDPR